MPLGLANQVSNTKFITDAHKSVALMGLQSCSLRLGYNLEIFNYKINIVSFTNVDSPVVENRLNLENFRQAGRASWYGSFFHGRRTANGERYNMHALTAAHRTLPLGAYVLVSVPSTSRFVVVRINDRGPYKYGRVIDLSYAAAKVLGLQHVGTARVNIAGLSQQGMGCSMYRFLQHPRARIKRVA